ncbi:MAG: ImmA/IrrE family metallo-endopeptidase [Kofleriaceae bacterium]
MADKRSPRARAEALRLLEECGVTRPQDIDLERIAAANRVEIVYEDLDGATARVLRIGDIARIRISNRIEDVGWRRFSIAHELGHLRLGHEVSDDTHEAVERVCKPLDKARSIPEREASVFSSEFLMPEPMVRPRCAVNHVTLAPARVIATEFTTSVLASAMRFVELTDERCAIAYSILGRVQWIKPSASFPDWIPRGRRLDPRSAAFDYHESGTIDDTAQLMSADVWLPRDKLDATSVQLVEHSALIPALGVVYSMLWIPGREVRHLDLAS